MTVHVFPQDYSMADEVTLYSSQQDNDAAIVEMDQWCEANGFMRVGENQLALKTDLDYGRVYYGGAYAVPERQIAVFQRRLRDLYALVREWYPASRPGPETVITEKRLGTYNASALVVPVGREREIVLLPIGCAILGAAGRVDVKSDLGREMLVYLIGGGPSHSVSEEMIRETPAPRRTAFYRIEGEGWYHVPDKRQKKLPRLSREVFEEIVGVLSE